MLCYNRQDFAQVVIETSPYSYQMGKAHLERLSHWHYLHRIGVECLRDEVLQAALQ